MTRALAALLAAGLLLVGSLALAVGVTAATIAPTTTCNNGLGNGGAVCEVTVVNTITPSGGSAVVTVRECTGSAGVPDTTCTNVTQPLSEPVTAVNQCNGTGSGGGGTLLCSVTVTNNFVGLSPTITAVTVNQCVGSVTTGTTRVCDPFPATTSGATITQCNGSANGGGTSLTCSASGTQSSGLAVTINQCNGSSNGGGTRTVCSATMINNTVGAGPSNGPSAAPAPSTGGGGGPTIPPTETAPPSEASGTGSTLATLATILVLGLLALVSRPWLQGARRR
ncbi:MAG TPA: hypothetical protein VFY18_07965 [Candidatus Limnocylindrales bacterium]|nr:hypothetical protein [Candidatus Limnocylindrales bacterium]